MVDSELYKYDQIVVDDLLVALGPAAYTGAATALICVFAASEELAVAVLDCVNVAVAELGALVVEAVSVADDLLEWWRHDLVGDWFAVDGVAYGAVLDFVRTVDVVVEVVAARCLAQSFFDGVAVAVLVKLGAWHWVRFVVDEAVFVTLDHWIDTKGEDVLVMYC